jgi:hypothetical protein
MVYKQYYIKVWVGWAVKLEGYKWKNCSWMCHLKILVLILDEGSFAKL